jgi:hypothetical protein
MSWDGFIIKGPKPSDEEMKKDDYKPVDIGTISEVINFIIKSLPGTELQTDTYLIYEKDDYSLEFDLECKDSELVNSINVSARGNGNPITAISHLCKSNGWELFDMQEAEFMHIDSPSMNSWECFVDFRNKVIAKEQKRWWEFWKK